MLCGVFLDLAGVLYEGDHAIPEAIEAVERLRRNKLSVRFVTNSTRRPKRIILQKLLAMGFAVDSSEILTPAEAACDWLRREGYAPHLLVHPDLEEDFSHLPQGENIAVVVGDAGRYFTYDRMNAAFRELLNGAPLLALATNRVFKDADGELSLDTGAFVQALAFSSHIEPILLGKPSPEFFLAGVQSMECSAANVIMIGDDAESDVAGALQAGIAGAILVRTGKYRDGDERRYQPAPSFVASDVAQAVQFLLSN